jgi:type III pantothenate kinase
VSLLAIDVGNTEVAVGLRGEGGWAARWQLRTSPRRTSDEYRVLLASLFRADGLDMASVSAVALSSVVPAVTPIMTSMCQEAFGVPALLVSPGIRTGMKVRYDPPSHLGSDRVLDAVAARRKLGAPVIVVDFGTATTFTVVDAHGVLAGGAIAPGLGVTADTLAQFGARLRRIDLSPADGLAVVGRNTELSMRSGVLYGHAALVEGLLGRMQRELAASGSQHAPVVATGGSSRIIAPLVPAIDCVDPDLTLDGLYFLHRLNTKVSAP